MSTLTFVTGRKLPDQAAAGFLLASLTSATVRDALVVQACRGLDAAYGGARSYGLLTGTGPGPDIPSGDSTGLPEWEPGRSQEEYLSGFARIMTGRTAAPPDWDRVDAATALLGPLYAAATDVPMAACGTLLAWLSPWQGP